MIGLRSAYMRLLYGVVGLAVVCVAAGWAPAGWAASADAVTFAPVGSASAAQAAGGHEQVHVGTVDRQTHVISYRLTKALTPLTPTAAIIPSVLVAMLIPVVYLLARRQRGTKAEAGPPGSPPEGLRPGPAGALLDGRATGQHVVATLVDLASRGYLRIDELEGGRDWGFVRGRPPGPELSQAEWTLLSALFSGRDLILLSALRYRFAGITATVRRQITQELVHQGWYRRHPDRQRSFLIAAGGALLALTLLGPFVHWLLGVAFLFTGAAVLDMAYQLKPLSAAGDDMCRRLGAFRSQLASAGPSTGSPDELRNALASHLPYAVAFELERGWGERFTAATAGPLPVPWYSGQVPPGDPAFAPRFSAFTWSAAINMSVPLPWSSSWSSKGASSFSAGENPSP